MSSGANLHNFCSKLFSQTLFLVAFDSEIKYVSVIVPLNSF